MSIALPFLFASPFELGGQAIDGDGDTHLVPGIHLRLAPSPDLGLPVEPLQVVRLTLGSGPKWPGVRHDIAWVDARGESMSVPFEVTPDNPVRGYLPRHGGTACCWLRVNAAPHGLVGPVFSVDPLVMSRGVGTTPRRRSGELGAAAEARVLTRRVSPARAARAESVLAARSGFSVRAFTMTEMGPAEMARRTRAPFEVAATPIDWIELKGRATVHGVEWLDARALFAEIQNRGKLPPQDPQSIGLWRALSMPVTNSVRYSGAPPDAREEAESRVKEGAPRRFGLHDDPSVSGPAASAPASADDELIRLADITPQLREYLQKLVDTLTPETLEDQVPIPPSNGTFTVTLLDAVLQALGDPSVARWLGHAVVDRDPPTHAAGDLIAYGVFGNWIVPFKGRSRSRRLGTVLCAVVGHPGDRPVRPTIDEPVGGPFLPVTPPDARRIVFLHFRDLVAGGGLAVARRIGSAVTGLNKRAPSGRAIAFSPGQDDEAMEFGECSLTDRGAPPEALVYRAGQYDWFGRWSQWAERDAAAAVRPNPPAPVLNAVYDAPEVLDPVPSGLLSGTISVEVPIPPVASLPTGGHLLDHLELSLDGAPQDIAVQNPADPAAAIQEALPGPGIEPAGQRTVTLVAHWVDQAGQRSGPSNPRTLVLNDPRPAPPVTFPPGLRYTARPDAMGQARFRLQWLNGPGQAFFRVFYTDETRLLRGLADLIEAGGPGAFEAGSALERLDGERDPAERAAIFEDVRVLFGRHLFEQITPQPLASPAVGSVMALDHAVSGALEVLSFYRVVSVTQAQVEAGFVEASLLPVRVPNTLTAPRPTLTVLPRIDPATGAFVAELTVSVPLGNVAPSEYRIRRAAEGADDVTGMPVIATGPLQRTPEGRSRAVHLDRGASTLGSQALQPWVRYVWRAEVRGPREPGAGPDAEWSPPSAPVAHMFVPPEPPPPPQVVGLITTGGQVELRFTHPDPFRGGIGQGYALEVYRQLPGERATLFTTIPAGSPESEGGLDAAGEFHVVDTEDPPPRTAYRVVARDPLGRRSGATAPAFIGEPV